MIMFITVILLVAIVGSLTLGLVVYLNNTKQTANRVFFMLAISIAIWTGFNLLTNLSPNDLMATWFARLTLAPALLITYSMWLLSYFFPLRRKFPKIINVIILSLIIICFPLTLTPYNIVESTPSGSTFTTGIVYYVTTLFFISLLIYALINYLKMLRQSRGNDQQRIIFIIIGFFATAMLGFFVAVILPIFGYNNLLPAVPVVTLILLASFAYAILKHKLFDIRLVVARSFSYILSIGLIATVYGFIAFRLFDLLFANTSKTFQQSIDIILAIVLAFTLAPLLRFFSKVSNKIFYRDQYDSQALINKIGRILASEIDLDKVSHKVIHELCVDMKIDKGEIVVFGEKQLFYENNVFKTTTDKIGQKELRTLGRTMLVRDDQQSAERKELMQKYGIGVSLALRTGERFIGYLLLSDKKSGDIYSAEDINVLKIIGSELSVAIQNALSYKEIQLFNETLTEKVRQRTAQLKSANDQLHLLDQAKDEFISMASHQLRTPLTTVKGYASMLDEGDFGKLTGEQRDKVELTLDGANRMARLIDDLLNVSRMDANRFFLEVTEVDIVKVVAEELQQLQSMAESKKVVIKYTPPTEKIPTIRLDENKTRQVIMNLVDNAIHYSQPPIGGGEANVSLKADDKNIEFVVRDNGIGVPADVQKRLFTKMFRANNAKAARPDGTGLGLYLVKRVIEDEGGEIIFESVEGKGSTFGFKLPLAGVPKEVEEKSRKIATKVAATQKSE